MRIVGRTETAGGETRFEWPGVSIQARFSGTEVSMELEDPGGQNEFAVEVDGELAETVITSSSQTFYPLTSGLSAGTHEIVVWRRTEAYFGTSVFRGLDFGTDGMLLPPPPAKAHRIEIIGDSITCGYGNEGTPGCSGTKPENNYLAYGSVAARLLDADLHTISWSGIGMYRNYGEDGPSDGTMPDTYDRVLPNSDDAVWDFSKFVPDAVVINLGTNDYSTRGDPGQPFVDAYVGFLSHLREVYPDAYIFCLVPSAEIQDNVDAAVSTRKQAGDTSLESFDISVNIWSAGCDGHPDVTMHAAMGEKLATEMAAVLGW